LRLLLKAASELEELRPDLMRMAMEDGDRAGLAKARFAGVTGVEIEHPAHGLAVWPV
jgi:hypothetical protein